MPDRDAARPGSILAIALAAAALTIAAIAHAFGLYLPSLNTPHTALEGVPHPPSALPPTPGLTRRLVVIVLDGLSYEAARRLEDLGPLRRRGVLRSLYVDFPTYTSPAMVSFATGLGPRDSGTRRNGDAGGVPGLDSVLREAGEAGVPIAIRSRGFGEFAELLDAPESADVRVGKFAIGVDLAVRSLAGARELTPIEGQSPARWIDFLHYGQIDDEGHEHGGRSPEYMATAREAAALVAHYARTLDLDQDSLVVLSDHGHVERGGHGGAEPEVRHALFLGAGFFFRRGVEIGERPMRDVAPTLAVLAGLRAPTSSLGLPMLDALALDDDQTSFVLAAPFDQAAHFSCALTPSPRCADVGALVARLHKPDPTAWPEAEEAYAAISEAHDARLADRRAHGAWRRLGIAAALLGVLALLAIQQRRRIAAGLRAHAALAPLVNAGVFTGYLWALGYRPTFSLMTPAPTFIKDAIPAAVLAAVAAAAVALWKPSGRLAPWLLLVATAAPFALLAAWVGWDPVTVPPPVTGVLVFQLAPALISASLGAVLLSVLAARRARADPDTAN